MFKRICFLSLIVCLSFNVKAQSISEILLHFPEKEMDVPMDIREKMVKFNGNTKGDYENYKLVIYDKRARFIRIVTPLEVIYEVSVWKLESDTLLVALCETRCGISCGSKIKFYRVHSTADLASARYVWEPAPAENYLPEFQLEDIFNASRLEKNYYTPQNIVKDFQVKVQLQLPHSGHDIMVIYTCLDELEKSEYQRIFKYLDGTMLDLVWNKKTHKFTKSTPYFLNN